MSAAFNCLGTESNIE